MTARIINGRKIAGDIKESLKRDISGLKVSRKKIPRLVALRIGTSASSDIYLNTQMKLAKELGIGYNVKTLPLKSSQAKIEKEIEKLNKNNSITGIIIQTPVPKHIKIDGLLSKIASHKDAEGLSPKNIGRLIYKKWGVAPCTASACMRIIDSTGVNLRGKEVVIVGHSEIVGKPLSLMLLSRFATTTVCHIGTYEKKMLKKHVRRAEVLIVSVGKAHLIKGDWIRKRAIVIDVGINRFKGGITGDVEFDRARKRASYITPMPGGVGPVTAVMLMENLVTLHRMRTGEKS